MQFSQRMCFFLSTGEFKDGLASRLENRENSNQIINALKIGLHHLNSFELIGEKATRNLSPIQRIRKDPHIINEPLKFKESNALTRANERAVAREYSADVLDPSRNPDKLAGILSVNKNP